jgi:hypothetical protein
MRGAFCSQLECEVSLADATFELLLVSEVADMLVSVDRWTVVVDFADRHCTPRMTILIDLVNLQRNPLFDLYAIGFELEL